MRLFMYLDDGKPVLMINGTMIRMSDCEFDALFYDMKMIARNQNA